MNIEIDVSKLINDIAEEVVERIKPVLNGNTTEEDILFTVETLANYLQVSNQWIYDRRDQNAIPFMKMGKFLRFRKREIDKWLDKTKMPVISSLSNKTKMVR